jgi:hypothetical protein
VIDESLSCLRSFQVIAWWIITPTLTLRSTQGREPVRDDATRIRCWVSLTVQVYVTIMAGYRRLLLLSM